MTLSSLSSVSSQAVYIQRDSTALRETTTADQSASSLRQLTQQSAKHLISPISEAETSQTASMLSASAPTTEPTNDSVRVTSTLGKAASSGRLTKEEAMAIYQKIAAFL